MSEAKIITPDTPIERPDQDALGRAGYARNLANALVNLLKGPGIVVGLNGVWGSGKSSIKNLILNEIRDAESPIEIVEFNPWQYESSSQLTGEFFSELAIAATSGVTDENERKERRAKFWKYGSRVAKVGAAGLSAFLPVVGVALEKGTKELIDQVGKVMEEAGSGLAESVNRKSLNEVKKELSDELAKLEKPILVVIDDIDRLDADETKLLFKLVKANADFPNVSYLLLFARDRVEKALDGSSEDGAKFLEKIVTVAFDVPALTREDTLRIFEKEVKSLVEDDLVSARLEPPRWERAKDAGIRPYLDTVRTVRRYTNMLRFLTSVYREEAGLNINFVDLAVLEVLREFEPKVYEQLPHMGPMLTENSQYFFLINNISKEQRAAVFLSLVQSAKDAGRQPMVRACLDLLFPQIDWKTGDWSNFTRDDQELRDVRINRAAYFSRYFGFDLRLGVFYESQYLEVIDSTADAAKFLAKLDELSGDQFLGLMLLMAARADEVPTSNYGGIFEALYRLADQNAGSAYLPEDVTPNALDAALLLALLARVDTSDEKKELIKGLAERIGALIMPVTLVNAENTSRTQGKGEGSVLDDQAFSELKDWALERIRSASQTDLIQHPALYDLLLIWGWLSTPEEPKLWVASLAGNPERVSFFLQSVVAPRLEGKDIDRAARSAQLNYAEDLRPLQKDLEVLSGTELEPSLSNAVKYALARNALLQDGTQ